MHWYSTMHVSKGDAKTTSSCYSLFFHRHSSTMIRMLSMLITNICQHGKYPSQEEPVVPREPPRLATPTVFVLFVFARIKLVKTWCGRQMKSALMSITKIASWRGCFVAVKNVPCVDSAFCLPTSLEQLNDQRRTTE